MNNQAIQNLKNLEKDTARKIKKALLRVKSSAQRLPTLGNTVDSMTDENLGAFEEFMSRFSRLSDLFLSQYLRVKIQCIDPAFRGTFKDVLDFAEKQNWIDSADLWFEIRELRNRQAHEYEEEDLIELFKDTLGQLDRMYSIEKLLPQTTEK